MRKPAHPDTRPTTQLVNVTICDRGPRDPRIAEIERRQRLAGEEDQSQPGWDQGA